MNRRSSVLISLDGLSKEDFGSLAERLPKSSRHLRSGSASRVDCGVLTNAQAIWGELLTGVPWNENGCSGYSMPVGSLKETKPAKESDLISPIRLIKTECQQLVINVPLLLPTPQRIWFSDGSLPIMRHVSPHRLAREEPFLNYKGRAFGSIIDMLKDPGGSVPKCIEIEKQRLVCARKLMLEEKRLWDSCVVRVSVFDQLAHLFGPRYLADIDSVYAESISGFVEFLDEWLEDILGTMGNAAIISAFSHVDCLARVNLNSLLQQAGLLKFGQPDVAARRRLDALAVAALEDDREIDDDGPQRLPMDLLPFTRPGCQQPVIDTARTLAASPSQGCIYINSKDRFEDGIVAGGDFQTVLDAVRSRICAELEGRFGNRFELWSASESFQAHSKHPDLLVYIPGAEFYDSIDNSFQCWDRPHSTHNPAGFFWTRMSKQLPSVIKSTDAWRFCPENLDS